MAIMLRHNRKEFFVSLVFALACLALFLIFPTAAGSIFQKIISLVAFLFLIPLLYIKLVLKKKISSFGLARGDMKAGLTWSALSLLVLALVFYIIIHYTDYFKNYPLPQSVSSQFLVFLGYEIILVGAFLFLYDFFFRGFMLTIMEKQMGGKAILAQYFFFAAMFILSGGFNPDNLRYALLGLFSGIVAYKSESIWYFFAAGMLFMMATDAIFIATSR